MAHAAEEGYIKFQVAWKETPPFHNAEVEAVNRWRQNAWNAGFIGMYPDGVGYGNISQRCLGGHGFLITGAATGRLSILDGRHYCRVTLSLPEQNFVACEGPIVASSESMSHAAIYQECPGVHSVIHAHHPEIWQRLLYKIPTTDAAVPYGSPEMTGGIIRLIQQENLYHGGVLVTAGHKDGIFAFGVSLDTAFNLLQSLTDLP